MGILVGVKPAKLGAEIWRDEGNVDVCQILGELFGADGPRGAGDHHGGDVGVDGQHLGVGLWLRRGFTRHVAR